MSGEITKAALMGARVSVSPDCFPCPGGCKAHTGQHDKADLEWDGYAEQENPGRRTPEQMDADIIHAIMEMAGTIELPHNWKG